MVSYIFISRKIDFVDLCLEVFLTFFNIYKHNSLPT